MVEDTDSAVYPESEPLFHIAYEVTVGRKKYAREIGVDTIKELAEEAYKQSLEVYLKIIEECPQNIQIAAGESKAILLTDSHYVTASRMLDSKGRAVRGQAASSSLHSLTSVFTSILDDVAYLTVSAGRVARSSEKNVIASFPTPDLYDLRVPDLEFLRSDHKAILNALDRKIPPAKYYTRSAEYNDEHMEARETLRYLRSK